ncbi:hypothetical protein HOB10_03170 [Candidatus Parcubacteria bacterium]|jgi:O-antigen ligase/tetratricopeptide (TPR) repeat protein|nr:hypothetical protein [Candidatus Parcubacteria bacterium]
MIAKAEQKLLLANKVVIGLILLTPLIVHKLFVNPFEVPKILWFRILVELLLVLYVLLLAQNKKYKLNFRHPLVISVLAFVVALFLSGIFGVQWTRSWWGTLSRSSGLFNWLHILAFFLITISILKEKKDWLQFWKFFSSVSLLVSVYAIFQKIGWNVYESGVFRLTGTIGNAAMLAGYLLFGLFGFVYLLINSKNNWLRWYYLFGAIFNTIIIFLSQTRSAMIGLTAAVLFALVFLSFGKNVTKQAKNWLRIALILLVLIVGGLFAAKDTELVKSNYLLSRFTDIRIDDTTLQTRFYSWRGGLEAWQDKPIFGWGEANFNIAYNNYFEASFYDYVKGETWFDKAHNNPVEYLTVSGVIGLVTYLAIFVILVLTIIKLRKRDRISYIETILFLSLLIAYFIHNLIVFDSISTLISFMLFIGLVYGLSHRQDEVEPKQAQLKFALVYIIAAVLIFLFVNIRINIPVWQSTMESRNVMQLMQDRDYNNNELYSDLQSSIDRDLPWDWELIDNYTKPMMDLIRDERIHTSIDTVESTLEVMANRIEEIDQPELLDAKIYARFARVYTLLLELNPNDPYYSERAQHYLNRSLELSAERIPTMYILAQVHAFLGEQEEAVVVLDQARDLNDEIPQTYWSYALIYSAQEDQGELVVANVKKAVDYGFEFTDINDVASVLPVFQAEKDYKTLEYLYVEAIRLDSKNPQWYASLAAIYQEFGDKQKAIETVNRILEIDSAYFEQVQEFINSLE